MTRSPKTVAPDQLVSEALEILNSSKITALFVVEAAGRSASCISTTSCAPGGVIVSDRRQISCLIP